MAPRRQVDYGIYNMKNLGVGEVKEVSNISAIESPDSPNVDDVLLLQRACNYWNALSDFRKRRERNRKYYRGDQWGDQVYDPDAGEFVTEKELIKSHGKVPLVQNQIRQLLKNQLGQYLTDTSKTSVVSHKRSDAQIAEMLTNTIQYGLQVNRANDIDTRNFEEFMLSGAAAWKSLYAFIDKYQREDLWISTPPIPNMFFTPNLKDVRMVEMDLVGEFYDLYYKDIICSFAKTPKDEERLKRIYAHVLDPNTSIQPTGALSRSFSDNQDFYVPNEPDKGRVFEIWERKVGWKLRCHDWLNAKYFVADVKDKKTIDNENLQRLSDAAMQGADPKMVPLITYRESMQRFWTVKYLSWQGDVLFQQETPYEHKEHPYTLLLYPLVDGEVWGFVEDIIDQQRYINRLITLLDFIIGSSAKGVLLVPADAIADDFDLDQIAEEWTKFNGVIKVKMKPGMQMPQQISANSTNIGIHELLSLQLKFMAEISGVSGAVQGHKADSGTPASLYAQEAQNSTLNSRDYFAAYGSARTERDWKALKVQIQYYEDDRNLALSGSSFNEDSLVYKQERAQNVEFDMVLAKTPDSPVYRGIIESSLREFLTAQYIDFETYLRNSSLPFADNLLNDVVAKKKALMEGAMPGSIADPAAFGQVQQYLQSQGADASKANQAALAMANKYVQGLDNLN